MVIDDRTGPERTFAGRDRTLNEPERVVKYNNNLRTCTRNNNTAVRLALRYRSVITCRRRVCFITPPETTTTTTSDREKNTPAPRHRGRIRHRDCRTALDGPFPTWPVAGSPSLFSVSYAAPDRPGPTERREPFTSCFLSAAATSVEPSSERSELVIRTSCKRHENCFSPQRI